MVLAVPTSSGKTLIAQLLAVEYLNRVGRSVCYVAPTRSLCREVRRAMTSRVRVLQKETGPDLPDFPAAAELADFLDQGQPADVEVMTPERLAHLLRHDPQAVLERFGMFIFDEAQHLKETGRGFTLEADDRAAGLPQPRDRSQDRADFRRDGQRRRDRALAQPRRPGPAARVPVARPAAAARRLHHQGALGRDAGGTDPAGDGSGHTGSSPRSAARSGCGWPTAAPRG